MPWPSIGGSGGEGGKPPIEPAVLWLSLAGLVICVIAWQQGYIGGQTLLFFAMAVPSIIVHEVSHGLLAKVFGDRMAQRAGRLTINPLRHIDVWGTFVIPIAISIAGGPPIGYAKPVPVNTARMSRNQTMLVGLVGPAVNFVMWMLALLVLRVSVSDSFPPDGVVEAVFFFGLINLMLGVFNAIPFPPLDGAAVIERFLPQRHWEPYLKFRKYSVFVLIVLFVFFVGRLGDAFEPLVEAHWSLMPDAVQSRDLFSR